ncbi:MAG: toprim domain-containing protein [Bacteroidetes bacterium]|nr:toprim domain-containing protein [Bacteroidota bacterium]MCL6102775.1 toprim domain-containing protein [Bacteroidota bacterium]
MNCNQANQISIVSFLQERGINPVKNSGSSFFYCSPLRKDENPSFNVSERKNVWIDYGTHEGGTLVDLVQKMYNCPVSKALEIISGTRATPQTQPSFFSREQKELSERIEIRKIQPLQNKTLILYLHSRGITLTKGTKFLKEAYWILKNKETGEPETNKQTGKILSFFALAFKNDLGGYALRNQIWKGSSSPQGITTVPGRTKALNIFEGFFDFLSCLSWLNTDHLNGTTIVLNSLANLKNLLSTPLNFDKINLFLDNSTAGIEATNHIIEEYPHAANQSTLIYPGYEDFNDFLNNKKM